MDSAKALVSEAVKQLRDKNADNNEERVSIAIPLLRKACALYELEGAYREAAITHQMIAMHAYSINAPCVSAKEHADAARLFSRLPDGPALAIAAWKESCRIYEAERRWSSAAQQCVRIAEMAHRNNLCDEAISAYEKAALLHKQDNNPGTAALYTEKAMWLNVDTGRLDKASVEFKQVMEVYTANYIGTEQKTSTTTTAGGHKL